jgi:hypothetical protein
VCPLSAVLVLCSNNSLLSRVARNKKGDYAKLQFRKAKITANCATSSAVRTGARVLNDESSARLSALSFSRSATMTRSSGATSCRCNLNSSTVVFYCPTRPVKKLLLRTILLDFASRQGIKTNLLPCAFIILDIVICLNVITIPWPCPLPKKSFCNN